LLTASIRAIEHLFPIFGPRFTPSHVATTSFAGLAGEALFVALE